MPEGKFIKKLSDIAAGVMPGIGFKTSQVTPPPALLLTVVLSSIDAEHAAAAIDGGAEALIVRVNLQEDIAKEEATLKAVVAAAKGKPCGFVPVGPSVHGLEKLQQVQALGFDFVVVSAHDTPDILHLENAGKVMAIDHTFDNDSIKTINELDIDAVEVFPSRPEDFGKHFSIRDVMHYKLIRMMIRKPIIVRCERSIQPDDMATLRDVGVEGLVIDGTMTGSDPRTIKESTAAFSAAIAKLGPARKKGSKVMPIVPQVKSSVSEHEEEPE